MSILEKIDNLIKEGTEYVCSGNMDDNPRLVAEALHHLSDWAAMSEEIMDKKIVYSKYYLGE